MIPEVLAVLVGLAWPILFFVVILIFRGEISSLLRRLRRLGLPGQVELNLEEAKEIARSTEEAFQAYRKEVRREYDRLARQYRLDEKLESVLESDAIRAILGNVGDIPGFRCTVHVPDVLFEETLYQLLDYYPSGKGRGRIWSARYGIIGRAWRLKECQVAGSVPADARTLISDWGMTKEEAAAAGGGRKSFACVLLLDDEETAIGIFYIDATNENVFPADAADQFRLYTAIWTESKKRSLTGSISKLTSELRGRGPLIRLYG